MSSVERNAKRTILWAALGAAGVVVWLLCVRAEGPGETARAWRAVLVNFLFFTPLAAGLVVWLAVVQVTHAHWPGRLEQLPRLGMAFAPVSLVALVALWAASTQWAPWKPSLGLPQGAWLDRNFVFARDLVALAVFWTVAGAYVARRARGPSPRLAGWLIFTYAIVFSLLGFDLVMALDPVWFSTLFGGYYFISGMYAAVACWTFLSVFHPARTPDRLHDLGKLVVAFSLMTTYLAYSQLLPIWYEDLPQEVHFPLPRMRFGGWQLVGIGLLATVYLGPLVVLLTRWAKRTPRFLGAVTMFLLVCMWLERWWLVEPTFEPAARLGAPELAMAAAFLGALGLAMEEGRRRLPPVAGLGEDPA